MKRTLPLLLLLSSLFSCSSTTRIPAPELKSEIPIPELHSRGIAPINEKYKQTYYRLLPYLFYNENGTFNGIHGDFYNVKFGTSSDLNIKPGFWNKYGKYRNTLLVLIARSDTSALPLENLPITVHSSKHGKFEKGILMGNKAINASQQRVLFIKELELENRYDVLNKIEDDVITVNIEGQLYKFLNPEITLDE